MPQVASPPAKIHGHSHAQNRAARAAQAQDRGTPSLFDSLVAESDAPVTQQPNAAAAQSSRQADTALPATQKSATKPAVPSGSGSTQVAAPEAEQAAARDAAATAADQATLQEASATAAKTVADTGEANTSKVDAAKDQGKPGADQAATQSVPAAVDPTLAAAAAVPTQAAQPGDPSSGAQAVESRPPANGAAIDTTVRNAVPAAPADPADIAAMTGRKLEPFDGKGKPATTKPAAADGKTASPANTPAPVEDQSSAPQPQPDPAAAPAQVVAKPALADKAEARSDAQTHRDHIDAGTNATVKIDGFAPGGGAQATSATSAAAAAAPLQASGAGATPPPGAAAPPAVAVPLSGIAVEIVGRAQAGKNNFEIRLDPPELGRIQVKLSVDHQGQITSHLIADRPDTLDLLRRDASGLERALQDAGLKTAGNGLQFSLRDQSFNGGQNGAGQPNAAPVAAPDDALPVVDAAASRYARFSGRIGGIDIRV